MGLGHRDGRLALVAKFLEAIVARPSGCRIETRLDARRALQDEGRKFVTQ
jgi:hypothetical protein